MKRLDYEAPTMEEIVVEMEEGFLTGSNGPKNTAIVPTTGSTVDIHEQEGFSDIDMSDYDNEKAWK